MTLARQRPPCNIGLMHRRLPVILLLFATLPALAEDLVPAYFVRLPETVSDVFIAETSTANFHRFVRQGDRGLSHSGGGYMSIGLAGVGKQRNGDQRTPLGVYFVTDRLDTTRFHEKYGPTAFPLDYPNAWDRRLARTGDGIWVHGVDRRGGQRPPLDTDGCIALPNERLQSLADALRPHATPVIVTRTLRMAAVDDVRRLRAELEEAIAAWAGALEASDMPTWLALYDDDFRRWGMDKAGWAALSMQTLGERSITKVELSDLLLIADPEEPDLYLSRFRLLIDEGDGAGQAVEAVRRMYWRRSESGALRIIAEGAG